MLCVSVYLPCLSRYLVIPPSIYLVHLHPIHTQHHFTGPSRYVSPLELLHSKLFILLLISNFETKLNLSHDLGFFTEIGLGSPTQYFQVMIDISSPDSFIESAGKDYSTGYNASLSTSYKSNGTTASIDYGFWKTNGIVSQDTFHFGDLHIQGQSFQEASEIIGGRPSWDNRSIIRGALGLSPSRGESAYGLPNPLLMAASQGLLYSNLFALRLAEPGELRFGGVNQNLYSGNITHLPLTNQTVPLLPNGTWQTSAEYVAMGPCNDISWSLEGYTASFTTMRSFIQLPDLLTMEILSILGFEDIMLMPPSIDCQRRSSLPVITLSLGGHEFHLSAYDYTFLWDMEEGRPPRCVSAFSPLGRYKAAEKAIILGTAFLQRYYTVFDLDLRTIGSKST